MVVFSAVTSLRARYAHDLLRLARSQGESASIAAVPGSDPTRWNVARLGSNPEDDLALAEAGLEAWGATLTNEDAGRTHGAVKESKRRAPA